MRTEETSKDMEEISNKGFAKWFFKYDYNCYVKIMEHALQCMQGTWEPIQMLFKDIGKKVNLHVMDQSTSFQNGVMHLFIIR